MFDFSEYLLREVSSRGGTEGWNGGMSLRGMHARPGRVPKSGLPSVRQLVLISPSQSGKIPAVAVPDCSVVRIELQCALEFLIATAPIPIVGSRYRYKQVRHVPPQESHQAQVLSPRQPSLLVIPHH